VPPAPTTTSWSSASSSNPTQFGPSEDLAAYPRDPDGDAVATEAEGVDVLFTPAVDEMYAAGARTTVHVSGLTERLCGASRPGHFDGVTTVVAKLFSIIGPCRAYFGRKDAQQLAVIRRMTADLDLPVDVVGCPLVREPTAGACRAATPTSTPTSARPRASSRRRSTRRRAAITRGERDADAVHRLIAGLVATRAQGAARVRRGGRRRDARAGRPRSTATRWSRGRPVGQRAADRQHDVSFGGQESDADLGVVRKSPMQEADH
jgi:pantoate--beta-alanine ligase